MHLVRALSSSHHDHFGYFRTGDESLAAAMHLLVERTARALRPRGRVLDLGCGMGGTTALLARAGQRVTGVDVEGALLDYAGRHVVSRQAVRLVQRDLAELDLDFFAGRYDGVVMTEVLQHVPSLERLFARLKPVLAPGATVLVHDLWQTSSGREAQSRFGLRGHTRDELLDAAASAGLAVVVSEDVTPRVRSTPMRLLERLDANRRRLREHFADSRPVLEAEMDDFAATLGRLHCALEAGSLCYESTVLRAALDERA